MNSLLSWLLKKSGTLDDHDRNTMNPTPLESKTNSGQTTVSQGSSRDTPTARERQHDKPALPSKLSQLPSDSGQATTSQSQNKDTEQSTVSEKATNHDNKSALVVSNSDSDKHLSPNIAQNGSSNKILSESAQGLLEKVLLDRTYSSGSDDLSLSGSFNSLSSSFGGRPCSRFNNNHRAEVVDDSRCEFVKPSICPSIPLLPTAPGGRFLSVSDSESVCSTPSPDTPLSAMSNSCGPYDFSASAVRYKRQKVKHRYNLDEVLEAFVIRIPKLLEMDDFNSEIKTDIQFIKRRTSYSPDENFRLKVADKLIETKITDLFVKVWKSVHSAAGLLNPGKSSLMNLLGLMVVFWNTSDISLNMCHQIIDTECVQYFVSDLKSGDFGIESLSNSDKVYFIKATMGTIHNICRHIGGSTREIFRQADCVGIMQSFLTTKHLDIKIKVLLILPYLIDEHENEILNADDGHIAFLSKILKSALDSDSHFSNDYGFHANEIVDGLNHLAANDGNKTRIVKNNGLPLYLLLMERGRSSEEQRLAAKGLWILAFNDDCKKAIKIQEGCMEALHKLWKTHSEEDVRHAARGAIWEVNASHRQISQSFETPDTSNNHIMISYQWDSKPTMIRVKDHLKKLNYKVWMDIEHMSGSTLEAMALAVERASVVIICMSQRYKDSPSCRSEAEYTYRLRKDVIPLRLQSNYEPDGWLGFILGTRLWFDISETDLFESSMKGFVKELGDRGKICDAELEPEISPERQWSIDKKISDVTDGSVLSWQQSDVQFWLKQNNLQLHCDKFSDYNGELLLEMKRMHRDCPSFLYDTLQRELGFKLKDILMLSAALSKLPV